VEATFSKISSLPNLPCKITVELTFEKFCPQHRRGPLTTFAESTIHSSISSATGEGERGREREREREGEREREREKEGEREREGERDSTV